MDCIVSLWFMDFVKYQVIETNSVSPRIYKHINGRVGSKVKGKSILVLPGGALLIIMPLLAACGGQAPASTGGPPVIPHTLEGRDDCLMCHGESGVVPFPADHAGRTVDICTACHQPAA